MYIVRIRIADTVDPSPLRAIEWVHEDPFLEADGYEFYIGKRPPHDDRLPRVLHTMSNQGKITALYTGEEPLDVVITTYANGRLMESKHLARMFHVGEI